MTVTLRSHGFLLFFPSQHTQLLFDFISSQFQTGSARRLHSESFFSDLQFACVINFDSRLLKIDYKKQFFGGKILFKNPKTLPAKLNKCHSPLSCRYFSLCSFYRMTSPFLPHMNTHIFCSLSKIMLY